jgi:large repetitive protein
VRHLKQLRSSASSLSRRRWVLAASLVVALAVLTGAASAHTSGPRLLADTTQINIGADLSLPEGNAGQTAFQFPVTLDSAQSAPVTVDFSTPSTIGSATQGSDYTPTSGTLTFAPGETTKTITVQVNGDSIREPDETFFVNLSNPSANATIGDTQASGTILNDDQAQSRISIGDVSLPEGDAGQTPFRFPVSLDTPQSTPVTVDFTTADINGATAGSDYTATSGTLTFAPGETSKTITVQVNGDTAREPDETFVVNLSNATGNANIFDPQASGTIINDDSAQTAQISIGPNVSLPEGDAGQTPFRLNVSLDTSLSAPVTVDFSTQSNLGTATAGSDYTPTSGTLTFAPGETSKTITVQVNGDLVREPDESFFVNLSNPSGNATILGLQASGTILNDDQVQTGQLSIDDVSLAEGDAGQTAFSFPVSLDTPQSAPVTVDFTTADIGSATAGSDYTATSGTLTFAPGETTKTITVQVNGDLAVESDEVFVVNLANVTGNVILGDQQASGTILNDDQVETARITIDDVALPEGDAGQSAFSFPVSLGIPQSAPVTVDFSTADVGSATAGSDYTATSGTLTFAPGETTKNITVQVNGDTSVEPNETFVVNLANVTGNASLGDQQAAGTILNDDGVVIEPPAQISIDDVVLPEGDLGQTPFQFTVSLDTPESAPVTVDYSTVDDTATAPSDYGATSGTLTFAPGETSKTITVQVNGDITAEPDETFAVVLTNATGNANIVDTTAVATILNDDPIVIEQPAQISIDDVSLPEGDAGPKAFRFTVSLDQAESAPVTVDYATANGIGTATVVSDYRPTSGTLTFAPGETSKTITVLINGDTSVEPDETFFVNLANATGNATIADAVGAGTILNDDQVGPSVISIGADLSLPEGDSGRTAFRFPVSLDTPQSTPVTVDFSTPDNLGTATPGSDYTAASGTLTFAPGETSKTITVEVIGDTAVEPDETFFVNLANATGNAIIGDTQATGTIRNDDQVVIEQPAQISVGAASLAEGNSGQTAFRFAVSLDRAESAPVAVDYSTANDTATAPSDYTATSGTLTFAPGETSKTITVQVNGDTVKEANETFSVNLTNATGNSSITDGHAVGTILNDDRHGGKHKSKHGRSQRH